MNPPAPLRARGPSLDRDTGWPAPLPCRGPATHLTLAPGLCRSGSLAPAPPRGPPRWDHPESCAGPALMLRPIHGAGGDWGPLLCRSPWGQVNGRGGHGQGSGQKRLSTCNLVGKHRLKSWAAAVSKRGDNSRGKSALPPHQEPGVKGVLRCKPRHYLGWSGAIGSNGGAAPCHGSAKPVCTGLGLQTSPASCLAAPCLSFPGSEEGGSQHAFAARTRPVHLHLAPDAVRGDHKARSSPGKEFVGFSSP